MPSIDHEIPLALFRSAPEILGELIRTSFGIDIGSGLTEASAGFTELAPAAYAADLVVRGEGALVVEVQLRRDDEKKKRWPLYAASEHALHGRPTWLVVVVLDPTVAHWAGQPIATFHGGTFVPLVIGPAQIPAIEELSRAREAPELAVLSALAHASDEPGRAVRVALAALAGASAVTQRDEDRGKLYADAVIGALDAVARELLEVVMRSERFEYRSDFARRYVQEGREEGREAGLREAVRTVCSALSIELDEERRAEVDRLDQLGLRALLDRLARERRWPV